MLQTSANVIAMKQGHATFYHYTSEAKSHATFYYHMSEAKSHVVVSLVAHVVAGEDSLLPM